MKKVMAFLICLLIGIALLLSGCQKDDSQEIAYRDTVGSSYDQVLEQILPEYRVTPSIASLYNQLERSAACEAFDVQALPAAAAGAVAYWYPHYLATVVIAVDRRQTDAEITGWRDLPEGGYNVGYVEQGASGRLLFAAISHGLDHHRYASDRAVDLLQWLAAHKRLILKDITAPVLICFDYQAVKWQQDNPLLEIIIPQEGTLSYEMGLVSRAELDFAQDWQEFLLDAGFRLPDGSGREQFYPHQDAYENVEPMQDYNRFNAETQNYTRTMRRDIMHTRIYSSADQVEHHMAAVLFIVLLIVWVGLSLQRILDPYIRRMILVSGFLLVSWVFLRYIRYQLTPGILNRFCWYGYYFFQLALSLSMLWLALALDNPGEHKANPVWKKIMLAVYGFLCLTVLTNDLHKQVFVVDLSRPDWSNIYRYGPIYYAIVAGTFIPVVLSMILLIRKAGRSARKGSIFFSIILFVLTYFYCMGYFLGIPIARDSDFTITIGLIFVLYYEIAMRFGLIPVNMKYNTLFSLSTLNMEIIDSNGEVWLSSAAGPPVQNDENILRYEAGITGGAVVWYEDVRELKSMQREIEENVHRLTAANALMMKEQKAKAELFVTAEKQKLTERLEAEIRTKTEKLSNMIEHFSNCENRLLEAGKITMLLCYLKRRCGLFFRERELTRFYAEDLVSYLEELTEFAEYAGVHLLITSDVSGMLTVRQATLFYDFFYMALSVCGETGNANVLVQLLKEDDKITMKILPSVMIVEEHFADNKLQHLVAENGGTIVFKQLDEGIGMSLVFRQGGR